MAHSYILRLFTRHVRPIFCCSIPSLSPAERSCFGLSLFVGCFDDLLSVFGRITEKVRVIFHRSTLEGNKKD